MTSFIRLACFAIVLCGLQACQGETNREPAAVDTAPPTGPESANIVVYAAVNSSQLTSLIDAYAVEFDVEVEVIYDDYSRLFTRLANSSSDSPGDLLIASSAADLMHSAGHDLLRPVYTQTTFDAVTEGLLDAEKYWFPLSKRARVVVVNHELVNADEQSKITSYASLADEFWKGRVCISSSRVAGNRLLVSMLLDKFDKRDAELIVRGWLANDSDEFYEDDFALLRAVASGHCQIAIADLSALAMHLNVRPTAPITAVEFDDMNAVLVDVSGIGVSRHAQNADGAMHLLAWLGTEIVNGSYARAGFEFPVTAELESDSQLHKWQHFVEQPHSVSRAGAQYEEAALLVQRARYP